MTSGPSPAGQDAQLESKLRGLERLHLAGIISDDTYTGLRAKLEGSAPPPAPAPAPAPEPVAPVARLTYAAPPAPPVAGPSWAFGAPAAPTEAAPAVSPPLAPAAEPVARTDDPEPEPLPRISRLTIVVPPAPGPAAEPGAIEPPAAEPGAIEPSAAEPDAIEPSATEPAATGGDVTAAESAAASPAQAPRWSFGPAEPAAPPAPEPARGWSVRESPRQAASAWRAAARGTTPHTNGAAAPADAEAVQPGSPPEATASPGPWPWPQPPAAAWPPPPWPAPVWGTAPWGIPVPPPPRPHRRHLALRVGLIGSGLAIVAAVAGGSVYVRARGTTAAQPSAVAAPSLDAAAPAPGGAAATTIYATLDQFVPDAKAFVQIQRGLTFRADVSVLGLADADFLAKLHSGARASSSSGSSGDIESRVFQALHFLPGGTTLGGASASAADAGIEGFYDFNTKELYVRGTQPTPYIRQVVVHELTHALQDQWFDVGSVLRGSTDDESAEARLAVIEGDARRIERRYAASLSTAEQQQASSTISSAQSQADAIPEALLVFLSFPYEAGASFDETLITRGGQAALDQAFRSPPATTAEVLSPDRYLHSAPVPDVTAPSATGPALGSSRLGALGFVAMFVSLVKPGAMTSSEPVLAARAWGADRFVAYSSGSRTCIRDTVRGVDASGQHTLNLALQRWIAATPGASLTSGSYTGTGPITFTSCTA